MTETIPFVSTKPSAARASKFIEIAYLAGMVLIFWLFYVQQACNGATIISLLITGVTCLPSLRRFLSQVLFISVSLIVSRALWTIPNFYLNSWPFEFFM